MIDYPPPKTAEEAKAAGITPLAARLQCLEHGWRRIKRAKAIKTDAVTNHQPQNHRRSL